MSEEAEVIMESRDRRGAKEKNACPAARIPNENPCHTRMQHDVSRIPSSSPPDSSFLPFFLFPSCPSSSCSVNSFSCFIWWEAAADDLCNNVPHQSSLIPCSHDGPAYDSALSSPLFCPGSGLLSRGMWRWWRSLLLSFFGSRDQ